MSGFQLSVCIAFLCSFCAVAAEGEVLAEKPEPEAPAKQNAYVIRDRDAAIISTDEKTGKMTVALTCGFQDQSKAPKTVAVFWKARINSVETDTGDTIQGVATPFELPNLCDIPPFSIGFQAVVDVPKNARSLAKIKGTYAILKAEQREKVEWDDLAAVVGKPKAAAGYEVTITKFACKDKRADVALTIKQPEKSYPTHWLTALSCVKLVMADGYFVRIYGGGHLSKNEYDMYGSADLKEDSKPERIECSIVTEPIQEEINFELENVLIKARAK